MREKLLAGFAFALCVLLAAAPQTLAQKKVKTETIKEPATNPAKAQKRNGTLPEILRDVSALPECSRDGQGRPATQWVQWAGDA